MNDKAVCAARLKEELIDYNFAIMAVRGILNWLPDGNKNIPLNRFYSPNAGNFRPGRKPCGSGPWWVWRTRAISIISFSYYRFRTGCKRKDYANRQTMFEKTGSLKYTLDSLQTSNAQLIVMGDLNLEVYRVIVWFIVRWGEIGMEKKWLKNRSRCGRIGGNRRFILNFVI